MGEDLHSVSNSIKYIVTITLISIVLFLGLYFTKQDQQTLDNSLIPLSDTCDFGRKISETNPSTGDIIDTLFLAKLQCSKIQSNLDARYKINDYVFDKQTGRYDIKLFDINSDRIAGDGILSGDRVLGKHLMFTSLHRSGDMLIMTSGTGP